jgi:hypothetical protein
MRFALFLGVGGFFAAIAGCNAVQTSQCVPGQSIACTAKSGCDGSQVCKADGTYDACSCQDPASSSSSSETTGASTSSGAGGAGGAQGTTSSTGAGGAAPSCFDNAKNGNETDIDCGGIDCVPCANGSSCFLDNDCVSGVCHNIQCEAACSPPGVIDGPLPNCINVTARGTPSASAVYDGTTVAAKAVDQNPCTEWSAGGFPPASLTLQFDPAQAMRGVTLLATMSPDGPVSLVIETSDDGTTYQPRKSINNQLMANGVEYVFDFGATVTAKFVRVRSTQSVSWAGWKEVAVFDCP